MALVLSAAWKARLRAAAVAADSLPPIWQLLKMVASSQFRVAKLMACPFGSWVKNMSNVTYLQVL